jgi:hypothetical protein
METVTARDALKRRVETYLKDEFPGSEMEWEDDTDLARPGGTVIWSGFADMPHIDRQRSLGDYLRNRLQADKTQLGMIFTLTPEERDFIRQEA